MTDAEILAALSHLKVQTGSLACLGCGYEHNCGVHGCTILREAAGLIERQAKELAGLRSAREWIPVKERLPELGAMVFGVVSGKPTENCTYYNALALVTLYDDGWFVEEWPEWEDPDVTYWMPLPDGPEVTHE